MTDKQQFYINKNSEMSASLEIKTMADLSKIFISNENKKIVMGFGHTVSLFFSDGSVYKKREMLNEVFFDYINTFRDNITHTINLQTHRMNRPLGKDSENYFRSAVGSYESDDIYSVSAAQILQSGSLDVPTPYFITGLANELSSKLSFVDMYLPADWVERTGYNNLREKVVHWCNILRPLHGTCGLGTIFAPSTGRGSEGAVAFPFLKRFPGLDYNDTVRWLVRSEMIRTDCIRTINWLTIIDQDRIDLLGGRKKLDEELNENCKLYYFDGGGVIQAGDQPELGDRNKGNIPEAYRIVARALDPVIFKDYNFDLLSVPTPLDGREETIEWINRFNL